MNKYVRQATKAQENADAMVGQKYDRILVVESIGVCDRSDLYCVVGECDCGDRRIYAAATLRRKNKRHMCPTCGGYKKPESTPLTICWKCGKATNRYLCPWADGHPRDDWEAVAETVKYTDRTVESWRVIKCPGFEEDKPR